MDESERLEFGKEIRAMRRGQDLNQEALAEKAGVSVRTIRNLEGGHNEPQPGKLACVLDALGYRRPDKPWDDSIEAFLQMVGWRLSRLEPPERTALIGRLTLIVIGEETSPNGSD